MFSYEPLYKTLVKKKLTIKTFMEKIGGHDVIRRRIMDGGYLSMEMLDIICRTLDCKIQDVIEYREGEQVVRKLELYTSINWDKFESALNGKGLNIVTAAEKLGKSRSYLMNTKYRNYIKRSLFREICSKLGFTADEISSFMVPVAKDAKCKR